MISTHQAAPSHIKDLSGFITDSPSSFHAAHVAAKRLDDAGFSALSELEPWPVSAGGKYYVVRDGAIIAWVLPAAADASTPFNVLGAHTDSPGFKLKPKATGSSFGWLQAGVEVYGGPLLNSWLDRELQLAGRLVTDDGVVHLCATGPLLRFPQLAIHLDREVNSGLSLAKQKHMNPIWGLGVAQDSDILEQLAGSVQGDSSVDPATIVGYDIVVADTQEPRTFGAHGEFFAAARLDNLSSVHAGLCALISHSQSSADTNESANAPIAVLCAFDHEEVGSSSRSGANGSMLEDVLDRISDGFGATVSERRRALAKSFCISADAGHAIHPNYPEKHDPANQPLLGSGPLLKINANQRYATDGIGAGIWASLCARVGVNYQEFVSHNDLPCGSTIGPLTATRLGIRTVDVGVALLSMHSAREMCSVTDPYDLAVVIAEFFRTTV